ncbi:MAG: response regulator transcription factor [Bacteroidales bacterium]|nr:response regulator transcription factor [Bacteroidales bacterium]
MATEAKIFIVDDHEIFREGLQYIIESDKAYKVCGTASNGKEFLGQLLSKKPNMVLMDVNMPEMDGIEATERALIMLPKLLVIALSNHNSDENYLKMIKAGVKGFVSKGAAKSDLLKAIKDVYMGNNFFSNEILVELLSKMESNEKSGQNIQKQETIELTDKEKRVASIYMLRIA